MRRLCARVSSLCRRAGLHNSVCAPLPDPDFHATATCGHTLRGTQSGRRLPVYGRRCDMPGMHWPRCTGRGGRRGDRDRGIVVMCVRLLSRTQSRPPRLDGHHRGSGWLPVDAPKKPALPGGCSLLTRLHSAPRETRNAGSQPALKSRAIRISNKVYGGEPKPATLRPARRDPNAGARLAGRRWRLGATGGCQF